MTTPDSTTTRAAAPAAGAGRPVMVLLLLVAFVFGACLVGIASGAYRFSVSEIFSMLTFSSSANAETSTVFTEIRLPRVLLGLLVGACLGAAGGAMQGLFRNPLADPGLVGITSGASVGAACWTVLIPLMTSGAAIATFGAWGQPIFAFAGAIAATLLVWFMASSAGRVHFVLLLLAGVATNALGGALLGLLMYVADPTRAQELVFWLMGGLGGATWQLLGATAICFAIGFPVLLSQARSLDLLALGEGDAFHLGVNLHRMKVLVVGGCALVVAGAVAAAGGIGFIGFVVPHIVRMLARTSRHGIVIPGSALAGAGLLVLADSAARTMVIPAEVPVGILTALIGTPFLIALLWRRRSNLSGIGS